MRKRKNRRARALATPSSSSTPSETSKTRSKQSSRSSAPYSATDICQILDACGRAKVCYIELGHVKVSFSTALSPAGVSPWQSVLQHGGQGATLSESERVIASRATLAKEEAQIRQNQVEDLILTDPLEFERRLMSGEFSDEEESGHGVPN